MLAAAPLPAAARRLGARVVTAETLIAAELTHDGRVSAVRTDRRTYAAGAVVNAAGT
jgi:glycine/D-amino acid oxidase-like deaminating enzyme